MHLSSAEQNGVNRTRARGRQESESGKRDAAGPETGFGPNIGTGAYGQKKVKSEISGRAQSVLSQTGFIRRVMSTGRNRERKASLGRLDLRTIMSDLPVRGVGRVISCGPSFASLVISFPIFLFPIHILSFFLLLVSYTSFLNHMVGDTRQDTRHFGTW